MYGGKTSTTFTIASRNAQNQGVDSAVDFMVPA
jgi:hypothetical protein